MRIVKSLLLGSAAGLVAVAGAQAADLPVKAKPVEYVKICNLYGDGFFYIPGTETCIRIGSNTQADMYYNSTGGGHPYYDQAQGANDRTVSQFSTKARGDLALDSRTQTAYGTLRTYQMWRIDNVDQGTVTPNLVRNFIQWAGFTFGHTKSFADPIGTFNDFKAIFQEGQLSSATGANGTNQISYTWELGNGAVLVLGADERKNNPIINLSNSTTINGTALAVTGGQANASLNVPNVTLGSTPTTSRGGQGFWDPYVAFRMSQAWGGFTSSIHASYNAATYNGYATTTGLPGTNVPPAGTPFCAQPGTTMCGHPGDRVGWSWNNGIEIKLPMIADGDRIGGFASYGVGALRHSFAGNTVAAGLFGPGNTISTGIVSDAVYVNGSAMQQTTGWAVGAAYEHWWNPQLSSAIYGGTGQVSYNSTVVTNRWFCGTSQTGPGAAVPGVPTAQSYTVAAGAACDPGFTFSQIGGVISWFPVPGLKFAVGALHSMIGTGFAGQVITLTKTQGLQPTGAYATVDKGVTAVNFRVSRTFGGVGD